jgi:alkylated DNA repair dioxygenase AlkB
MEIKTTDKQEWTFLPGNSVFINKFISKSIADYLFKQLESEIVYIKRGILKFRAPNGKDVDLPRMKQFYGSIEKSGNYPQYDYGGDDPPVLEFTPTLKIILILLNRETGQKSNHCIVNRYEKGQDYIGYHHDKTKSLYPNSKVIVLSLGETRIMDIQNLTKIKGKTKTKKIASIDMIHGSLFELTLETNKNHKHQIRKTKLAKKIRLGLTFRSVREYVNVKTGKTYYVKL